MLTASSWRLASVLALALSLSLTACDSGTEEPPPPPPPPVASPTFAIASQVVPLQDGSQGLQFAFTPSENVQIVRVDIRSPLGAVEPFNGNNTVFLGGTAYSLQDPGLAYSRISGTWTFTFIGSTAPGGVGFTVATPVTVSALTETPSGN